MRHAQFLGAVVGLVSVVAAQSASASPTSTPVSGISAPGETIARAADGSMWLTEPASPGRVARVAPGGIVTEYTGGVSTNLTAGSKPNGMAITPDGYAWFLMDDGNSEVGRVSLTTGAVETFALNGGTPTSIAAGPDGNLWMSVEGILLATDFIVRYNVADKSAHSFSSGLSALTDPETLTAGSDASLSFTEDGSRVGRITTTGSISFQSVGGTPTALGVGPTGDMWFSRGTKLGRIGIGTTTLFPTDNTPTAIATGPDGALWSAATGGIIRVGADGTATTFAAGLDPSARGTGLAAGPDGRMWMTLDRAPHLVRITVPPRIVQPVGNATSATTATVTVDVRPNGLATTAELQIKDLDGGWSTVSQAPAGDGVDAAPVQFDLDGIAAESTTTLRVIATNEAGSATSPESAFSTSTEPPPTPTPTPDPTPDPTPTPTPDPTPTPTPDPTPTPTPDPDPTPTPTPDPDPTPTPTPDPTPTPTPDPTPTPTPDPTPTPTPEPTLSLVPVATVTPTPTPTPDPTPTATPDPTPTPTPSPTPEPDPTVTPTPTIVPDLLVLEPVVPAPVQGDTVVVSPIRGTVTFRVPGSTTVRAVDGAASIPTGSIVDATKGAVALESRVDGAVQEGRFSGGQFKVKQVKATGMTQLYLNEPLDCAKPGSKATRSAAKKKRRHVWGEDKKGRFETHGKDSVATVRGTRWLTTDTCGGTVIKVFEGSVLVTPRRGKAKPVIVRAGGRHVTRPAKR